MEIGTDERSNDSLGSVLLGNFPGSHSDLIWENERVEQGEKGWEGRSDERGEGTKQKRDQLEKNELERRRREKDSREA